jgi:hypothetical protein
MLNRAAFLSTSLPSRLLRSHQKYRGKKKRNKNVFPTPTFTLRLLFLQAHRETEAHFTAAGMSSQRNQSDSFRFKRAAFYNGLKSKVGLAAAKAAALRVNLNVQGCVIVAPPMHAPSRTPLLLPLLLSHNLLTPRVH